VARLLAAAALLRIKGRMCTAEIHELGRDVLL
jgi:hypothetical protein